MMEDSKTIHRSLMIMQVSKNLERIADHAKGIADMVTIWLPVSVCVIKLIPWEKRSRRETQSFF